MKLWYRYTSKTPSVVKKSRHVAFDGSTTVFAIGTQLRLRSQARLSVDSVLRWLSVTLAMVAPMPLMPSNVRIEPDRSTNAPVCNSRRVIRAATASVKASVWNVERLPFPSGPADTFAGFNARKNDANV